MKTVISINAKEAQPNDDPNQKPSCNITYIYIWDTAGQACCTMTLTELQARLVAQWQWQNCRPGLLHCDTDRTAGQACCTMTLTERQYSETQKPYLQTGYGCTIRKRQQWCTSAGQPMAINVVPMSALPIPNDHTTWKTQCRVLMQAQLPSSQQHAIR